MIRILYFDVSEMRRFSRVTPEEVLFFLNNPVHTFFSMILKGPTNEMIWDLDPNKVYDNREAVFQTLLEKWEEMNLIDERTGIFTGTGYTGTVDYIHKKLNYYSERFYSVLVPAKGGQYRVEELSLNGDQLVIRLNDLND